jgi:hypothetical protein
MFSYVVQISLRHVAHVIPLILAVYWAIAHLYFVFLFILLQYIEGTVIVPYNPLHLALIIGFCLQFPSLILSHPFSTPVRSVAISLYLF